MATFKDSRRRLTAGKASLIGSSFARRLRVEALEDRRMLAVITVNSAADNLSADGLITLREAIQAANTNASVDGSVAGEVGPDTIAFDRSEFTGGATSLIRLGGSELEITESLTIDGAAGVDVTITGDSNDDDVTDANDITDVDASLANDATSLDDNSRVLNFSAVTGDLTISNLTITGGRTTGDNAYLGNGQGLETTHSGGGVRFVSDGTLTLHGTSVSGNSTAGVSASGAGVYSPFGTITLTNSTLSGNRTSRDFSAGGGIATNAGAVTLHGSKVTGNSTAGDFAGGGAIDSTSGTVSLNDSEVSGNSTAGNYSFGGGVSAYFGDVTLTRSTVSGNSTTGERSRGGGLSANDGMVTVTDSTVSGNNTAGFDAVGGGILTVDGDIEITRSTVSGNFTLGDEAEGGGIRSSYGNVTLTNSTVSGNSTAGEDAWGGGIRTWYGDVSLISSTITENSTTGVAAHGGGVFVRDSPVDAPLTFVNSIVANNSVAPGSLGPDFVPDPESAITLDHSLIGNNADTGLSASPTPDGNGNLIGTMAAPIDPLLGALADNGGPTLTHAFTAGSPAIDAGDLSLIALDTYGPTVLSDNPTVFLRFEETTGTVANDSSGNGYLGEYFGSPNLTTAGIGSDSASALGLDGVDDLASVENVPITASFTAESWAFSANPTWNKFGWTATSQEPNGFIIHPNEGERTWVGYVYDDAANFFAIGGHTPDDITGWHHYAITYDGAVARMFFDGEMVIEAALSVSRSASSTIGIDLGFDECCGGDRYGAGGIDEFALYPAALSPESIAAHYTASANDSTIFDQRGFPFARTVGAGVDIGAFELGATSADFDGDGSIDGGDFLAWQRGFGKANASHADGNADYDNDVDSTDLAAWELAYGQVSSSPSIAPITAAVESSSQSADPALFDAALALAGQGERNELSTAGANGNDFSPMDVAAHGLVEDGAIACVDALDLDANAVHENDASELTWLTDELLEQVFAAEAAEV